MKMRDMGNFKKTMRYFKRNGFRNTYYAVLERLFYKDVPFNTFDCVENFSKTIDEPLDDIFFSVLVPVYETPEKYLRDMIESVLNQTYPHFELILGDASKSDAPKQVIESYTDTRIRYIRIPDNKGISANTNVALAYSKGEYVALLDHDDLLTEDALYENALMINTARKNGINPALVYSDEDKCVVGNGDWFDPHIKQKFNYDLFLSNNYICHLSVIDGNLARTLGFRPEYDGSQDYDFLLRVVAASDPKSILHISKVLYHWRCHENSTAFDPASKEYAYDAGRRAIEDFLRNRYKKDIHVSELLHKGFYMPMWTSIFEERPEIGAFGTILAKNGKVKSGIIHEDGSASYEGISCNFSGYMHRLDLYHDVFALDIRTVTPSSYIKEDYDELMAKLDSNLQKDEYEKLARELSVELGKRIREKNHVFLYVPRKKSV